MTTTAARAKTSVSKKYSKATNPVMRTRSGDVRLAPATLTFFSADVYWRRLNELALRGNRIRAPFTLALADRLAPNQARHAYRTTIAAGLSHFLVATTTTRLAMFASLLRHTKSTRTLYGLESWFITGLNTALIAGHEDLVNRGTTAWKEYGPLAGVRRAHSALFIDTGINAFTGLGARAVEQFGRGHSPDFGSSLSGLFGRGYGGMIRGIADRAAMDDDGSSCRTSIKVAGAVFGLLTGGALGAAGAAAMVGGGAVGVWALGEGGLTAFTLWESAVISAGGASGAAGGASSFGGLFDSFAGMLCGWFSSKSSGGDNQNPPPPLDPGAKHDPSDGTTTDTTTTTTTSTTTTDTTTDTTTTDETQPTEEEEPDDEAPSCYPSGSEGMPNPDSDTGDGGHGGMSPYAASALAAAGGQDAASDSFATGDGLDGMFVSMGNGSYQTTAIPNFASDPSETDYSVGSAGFMAAVPGMAVYSRNALWTDPNPEAADTGGVSAIAVQPTAVDPVRVGITRAAAARAASLANVRITPAGV